MIKGKSSKVYLVDMAVEFGGVSIGENTARLGIRFSRSDMKLDAADKMFVGHRLKCRVALGGGDDSPGQGMLIDDYNYFVDAVADVKRIGVSPDTITTGLTFSLKDVDIQSLAKFSKGSGRLAIDQVTEIPVDNASGDDDEDDNTTKPGTFKTDTPWRKVQLDTLFHGSLLKSLKAGGLATVGDLHDYQQPGLAGWEKRLTDIKGIGESAVEKIGNRMIEFWRDNPQDDPAAGNKPEKGNKGAKALKGGKG